MHATRQKSVLPLLDSDSADKHSKHEERVGEGSDGISQTHKTMHIMHILLIANISKCIFRFIDYFPVTRCLNYLSTFAQT